MFGDCDALVEQTGWPADGDEAQSISSHLWVDTFNFLIVITCSPKPVDFLVWYILWTVVVRHSGCSATIRLWVQL